MTSLRIGLYRDATQEYTITSSTKNASVQYKMSKMTCTQILSPGGVSVITDIFDTTKRFGTWKFYLPHMPWCEEKYLY